MLREYSSKERKMSEILGLKVQYSSLFSIGETQL